MSDVSAAPDTTTVDGGSPDVPAPADAPGHVDVIVPTDVPASVDTPTATDVAVVTDSPSATDAVTVTDAQAGVDVPHPADAAGGCTSDAACVTGMRCAFAIAQACAAVGTCVTPPAQLPCRAIDLLTGYGCSGTTVHWTGGCAPMYPTGDAAAPVVSMGACP